jgi:hypothetical protein
MAMMSMKIPRAAMAPVKAEKEKLKKRNVYSVAFVDYFKLCSDKENNYFMLQFLKRKIHILLFYSFFSFSE